MKPGETGLELDSTRLLFGFVYLGYNESDYFWEFSKIFLRIGMQLNYELITEQLLLKEVFIGTMLLFYCYWVKKRKPYKKNYGIFNYYDLFINLTLFLNVYQSHLVNTYTENKDSKDKAKWELFHTVSLIVVLCVNGVVASVLLMEFCVIV